MQPWQLEHQVLQADDCGRSVSFQEAPGFPYLLHQTSLGVSLSSLSGALRIEEHLRAELAAVKSSQKADREHLKTEIDSLNTTVSNMEI